MGLPEGKTRITLEVKDDIGVLHDITGVFKELGISIGSLANSRLPDGQVEIVFRADIPDVDVLKKRLAAAVYPVQHVAQIGN
jgi:acetoin utilization protein AcuB